MISQIRSLVERHAGYINPEQWPDLIFTMSGGGEAICLLELGKGGKIVGAKLMRDGVEVEVGSITKVSWPEPIGSEPVTGEPVTGEPVTGEPVTGEPVTGEPVTGEPVTGEPVTGEPLVDEPLVDEPLVDEPLVDEPLVDEGSSDSEPELDPFEI